MAQLSAHPFDRHDLPRRRRRRRPPVLRHGVLLGTEPRPSATSASGSRVEDALRIGIRLAGGRRDRARGRDPAPRHQARERADDDYGWPALTDFGIASNLEGELPVHTVTSPADASATSSGQSAVGMSVPWSPPEMFEDDPRPDQRSDVFSLAATVHTLLAGRTPFEIPGRPNGSLDLIGRIERGAITPIDRADVPRSLASVLAKGMAVRREDRYPECRRVRARPPARRARARLRGDDHRGAQPGSERTATDDDEADATRARAVRSVEAQPRPVPTHDDATRAAHAAAGRRAASVGRAGARGGHGGPARRRAGGGRCGHGRGGDVGGLVDATVVRAIPPRPAASASVPIDATQVRPRTAVPDAPVPDAASAETRTAVIGSRVGRVVGIAAGLVVVWRSASPSRCPEPSSRALPTRPLHRRTRTRSSPPPCRRPRWTRACGRPTGPRHIPGVACRRAGGRPLPLAAGRRLGLTEVSDGPAIVVAGVAASERVCIDVQVQRGSKTSETVTGCTP